MPYLRNYNIIGRGLYLQLQSCFTLYTPRRGLLSLTYNQLSLRRLLTLLNSARPGGAIEKLIVDGNDEGA